MFGRESGERKAKGFDNGDRRFKQDNSSRAEGKQAEDEEEVRLQYIYI